MKTTFYKKIWVSFRSFPSLWCSQYERDGLIKRAVSYEIPLDAIREALVNAVAHRAYDYEAPISITHSR
ncbi:MAG: hypothetical protein PQJ48_11040 [Sphaerochaetaceae bacterium]|nr:hypothetical protein [Sphaerochaetaceae bacterium]